MLITGTSHPSLSTVNYWIETTLSSCALADARDLSAASSHSLSPLVLLASCFENVRLCYPHLYLQLPAHALAHCLFHVFLSRGPVMQELSQQHSAVKTAPAPSFAPAQYQKQLVLKLLLHRLLLLSIPFLIFPEYMCFSIIWLIQSNLACSLARDSKWSFL